MMVVIEARIPKFPNLIPKLAVSQLAYTSHIMCIVTIWQPKKKKPCHIEDQHHMGDVQKLPKCYLAEIMQQIVQDFVNHALPFWPLVTCTHPYFTLTCTPS